MPSFKNRPRRLAALRLEATVAGVIALASIGTRASADPAGWALNWADEFTGTALNSARWENLTRRDSYNNEKQYYSANQVSVGNGNLRITATNQALDGKPYRSGLVRTWSEQTYGRWDVRASLPTTQGMWPAIWLLPRNVSWPAGGEIDIMENRGSNPTVVSSAYHFGASVAAHQYVSNEFAYNVNGSPVSFAGGMHTYSVEWDNARIRYFVDAVPHFTFYRGTAPISSSPMSLIINLAVGGDFGGDPNASTVFPQYFDVDSVRNYNRASSTRALSNTGFESTAGNLFTEWDEYSNAGNVLPDAVSTNARTGSKAVQMFGRFTGGQNNSGLFQEVPTIAGEVWQIGGWSKNRTGDKLAGTNSASIKLEFIDQNGGVLSVSSLKVADLNSPTAYRESLLRRTAPTGAVFARAVIEMVQNNNAGGAVNFDDVTLRRFVSGSSVAGDLNLDGARDSLDLDAILHSLAAVNVAFDFDGNSVVNQADVDSVLGSAFGTQRGDINLDQHVNFDDLLTLAQNYDRTGTGTWAVGDLTGDSNVNFDDLLALAQHYDPASLGSTTGDFDAFGSFASDWELAQSMVPEPSGCLVLLTLIAPLTRRKADMSRRHVHSIHTGRLTHCFRMFRKPASDLSRRKD